MGGQNEPHYLFKVTSWLETYIRYSWNLTQVVKMSLITYSRSPVDYKLRRCTLVGPYTGHNEPHYLFKVTSWLETYIRCSWNLTQVVKMSLITYSRSPVDYKLTRFTLVGPYTGHNEPHYLFKVTS